MINQLQLVGEDTGVCVGQSSASSASGPRRFRVLLAAFLGSLAWQGCSTVDTTARIPAEAVARNSPVPQVCTASEAMACVRQYLRDHPGSDFAVGRGDSMEPLYRDRDVIILTRPDLSDLKTGQTVMFIGEDGIPTAHILVARTSGGLVTCGLNNTACDPGVLRDSAFMGVVVKAFRPNQSVILSLGRAASSVHAPRIAMFAPESHAVQDSGFAGATDVTLAEVCGIW